MLTETCGIDYLLVPLHPPFRSCDQTCELPYTDPLRIFCLCFVFNVQVTIDVLFIPGNDIFNTMSVSDTSFAKTVKRCVLCFINEQQVSQGKQRQTEVAKAVLQYKWLIIDENHKSDANCLLRTMLVSVTYLIRDFDTRDTEKKKTSTFWYN